MNKRYEALIALDIRGREEAVKDTIERLEKFFKAEGAVIEQVQRLEKRDFSYEHNHQGSAYYVNFIFEAEPASIEKFRTKLKLDADVTLQNYIVLPNKKAAAPAAA